MLSGTSEHHSAASMASKLVGAKITAGSRILGSGGSEYEGRRSAIWEMSAWFCPLIAV